MNWARVPAWLGGRLKGDHVAADVEAWTDLLCRWHQGEDPGPRLLMREWKWGAGRTSTFIDKAVAWAKENDARLPERLANPTGTNRNASGTVAEHSSERQTPGSREPRNASGTVAEQIGTPHAGAFFSGEEREEKIQGGIAQASEATPEPTDPGIPDAPPSPSTATTGDRSKPPESPRSSAKPPPAPITPSTSERPQSPPRTATTAGPVGDPPEWLDVGSRRVPGNLPALLNAGPGIDGREVPALVSVGSVNVIRRLLGVPIEDPRQMLRIAREQWFGDRGKCFVAGCAGIRDALDQHLWARWGVRLGDLATSDARGPPGRGSRDRAAAVTDALAELGAATNATARPNAIDAAFEEIR